VWSFPLAAPTVLPKSSTLSADFAGSAVVVEIRSRQPPPGVLARPGWPAPGGNGLDGHWRVLRGKKRFPSRGAPKMLPGCGPLGLGLL